MILFVILGLYFVVTGWLCLGFIRTPYFKRGNHASLPVSIIICARNEEKNIARCISGIINQEYDKKNIQLIIINDGSTDNTVAQAELALKNSGLNYRVITNAIWKGKKQSIDYAVGLAEHPLLLMRDADTFTLSTFWLQSIVDFYNETKAGLIICPIAISDNRGLLWALQAIENNVLAVLACGSAYYKKPFLCNGANLAYTRETYSAVNGFKSHMHVASGDDILFLEDVKRLNADKIKYLKASEAIVYTYPCYSLSSLLSQKTRWASKFRFNKNGFNTFFAILTFIVNALWLVCPVLVYFDHDLKTNCLLFILIKLCIDIMLLFLSSGFIKNRQLNSFALPVGAVYPAYAVVVSLASLFYKPKWK